MSEKMTTANSAEQGKVDIDFAECAVPKWSRRRFVTMFMIMLGFTFFSASMWVGQEMAAGLDFWGFIKALLLGGAILGIYTGLLGYVGAETGLSLDLLSKRAFGEKGSYISSALTSFTQIGWFGVGVAMFAIPVAKLIAPENPWLPYLLVAIAGICMTGSAFFGIKAMTIVSYISVPLIAILGITAMVMAVKTGDVPLAEKFAESQGMSVIAGAGLVIGSFVSGGTATPNFARFSKTALQSVIVTVVAFFIGNSLMFCFGAFSGVYVGGNDIFEVMVALNLTVFAIIVLGLNIWTTNDNALYTAGLGLSNITKVRKRPMVVISGILGTVTAVWLYNNFVGWLNILNCTLPPVGMIVVLGYFCHKEEYEKWNVIPRQVNWFAIAGVLIGAAVANLVPWGIASVNGMVIAAVCYLVGELVEWKKKK